MSRLAFREVVPEVTKGHRTVGTGDRHKRKRRVECLGCARDISATPRLAADNRDPAQRGRPTQRLRIFLQQLKSKPFRWSW